MNKKFSLCAALVLAVSMSLKGMEDGQDSVPQQPKNNQQLKHTQVFLQLVPDICEETEKENPKNKREALQEKIFCAWNFVTRKPSLFVDSSYSINPQNLAKHANGLDLQWTGKACCLDPKTIANHMEKNCNAANIKKENWRKEASIAKYVSIGYFAAATLPLFHAFATFFYKPSFSKEDAAITSASFTTAISLMALGKKTWNNKNLTQRYTEQAEKVELGNNKTIQKAIRKFFSEGNLTPESYPNFHISYTNTRMATFAKDLAKNINTARNFANLNTKQI